MPLSRNISDLHSPWELLVWTPMVSKALCLGGVSSLPCRSQELGCLIWGMNTSLLKEKFRIHDIPPYCVSLHEGGLFCKSTSLSLLPISMPAFLSLVVEAVQLVLSYFPVGTVPYVAVNLLCPWVGCSSGSSCVAILDHFPFQNYFYVLWEICKQESFIRAHI